VEGKPCRKELLKFYLRNWKNQHVPFSTELRSQRNGNKRYNIYDFTLSKD
jgi:hypothetical protein